MKRAEFDIALQGFCMTSGTWSLDDILKEEPADSEDIRRDERYLDHRGVVYLRHGKPASKRRGGNSPSDLEELVDAAITADANAEGLLPSGYLQTKQFRQVADQVITYLKRASAEEAITQRIRANES